MKALVLAQRATPAFGYWWSMARLWEPDAPGVVLDTWNSRAPWASGVLAARLLRRTIRMGAVDVVLAVGLEALVAARDLALDVPVVGVALRGEADFSEARRDRQSLFLRGNEGADVLCFDSSYESDKAIAKGSLKPHFILTPGKLGGKPLGDSGAQTRVAVVIPEEWPEEVATRRVSHVTSALDGSPDMEIVVRQYRHLYSQVDHNMGRSFSRTIGYRLQGGCDYAVLLGDSGSLAYVAMALCEGDPSRVLLEATIANTQIAASLGIPDENLGLGSALRERLELRLWSGPDGVSSPMAEASTVANRVGEWASRTVPWWFEECCDGARDEPLDVFFSGAAVENRLDGARPQRIRHAYLKFGGRRRLVLNTNANVLERRTRVLRQLLHDGVRPGAWYGELSTAPITPECREAIAPLATEFRRRGGAIGWYVRDLHWLSPESPLTELRLASRVDIERRGRAELQLIGDTGDVLFAPSEASGRLFNELLKSGDLEDINWEPLPPALAPENLQIQAAPASDKGEALRLVYAGGYGGIYDLRGLWRALAAIERDWVCDLVTRDADMPRIERDLIDNGIDPGKVRIIHEPFSDYVAPSGALGILLLESTYGFGAIPYKAVSYLEKGLTILTYAGMAVTGFVRGVGGSVHEVNDEAGLLQFLQEWKASDAVGWAPGLDTGWTWAHRMKEAYRSILDAGDQRFSASGRA